MSKGEEVAEHGHAFRITLWYLTDTVVSWTHFGGYQENNGVPDAQPC